jgi:hypothetical protein
MQPLIFVIHVQLVNYQETVELNKTFNAELSHRAVIEMVKSNSAKHNVLDAKAATQDNNSRIINAQHQDQHVLATNSTTQSPTGVTTVQLVNSQVIMEPTKMEDALTFNRHVTQMDKGNLVNNSAINVQPAKLDGLLEPTIFAHAQDQTAHATNLSIQVIYARTAQLVNLVPTEVLADNSPKHVTETDRFN